MIKLAEELIALEAECKDVDGRSQPACRVCEKLRPPLLTLVGTTAFTAVLSRALTLAQRKATSLQAVTVNPDGTLDGMVGEAAEAQVVLIACLLDLLGAFIGELLTKRLVESLWASILHK